MKRALIPVALAVAIAAGAPHAVAAPPTEIGGEFSVPCQTPDFELLIEYNGKYKQKILPNGEVLTIFPKTKATVTNLSDPTKAARYVITGTSKTEYLPGVGSEWVLRGSNLVVVPGRLGPDGHEAGLFFTRGNVNFALDVEGNEARLFSGSGNVIDVCEALA